MSHITLPFLYDPEIEWVLMFITRASIVLGVQAIMLQKRYFVTLPSLVCSGSNICPATMLLLWEVIVCTTEVA